MCEVDDGGNDLVGTGKNYHVCVAFYNIDTMVSIMLFDIVCMSLRTHLFAFRTHIAIVWIVRNAMAPFDGLLLRQMGKCSRDDGTFVHGRY